MKTRNRTRYFCVMVCAVGALLCALNRAPGIAAVMAVAAIILCALPFGRSIPEHELVATLEALKRGRDDAPEPAPSIRATVNPACIFLPMSERQGFFSRRRSVAFRDEWPDAVWREIATRLRLQPKPKPKTLDLALRNKTPAA